MPSFVDGRSLAGLLQNPNGSWREEALFQFWNAKDATPANIHQSYSTIRTDRYKYTEWYSKPNTPLFPSPQYELYDLETDPYEVNNIYNSADPQLIADLKTKLDYLKTCQGENCNETPLKLLGITLSNKHKTLFILVSLTSTQQITLRRIFKVNFRQRLFFFSLG